jgi:integrase
MGCLYKPKKSRFYWIKYYVNGVPRYESTGTQKETEARRFLKEREGRAASGQPALPRVDRIRYEEVAADLRLHYETTGARDLKEADTRLRPLARFFAGRRVASIGPADITAYSAKRQAEGVSNASINRELAVLGRMLRLASENGKLIRLPVVHKLKENAPRQGFFEREQYESVRGLLPADRQLAVAIEHEFGWRCQSEVLTLELRQIDLEAGTIRLDAGATKNDDGRVVYLPADLKDQIAAQIDRVRALERETGRLIPYLFPHFTSGHRYQKGDRIQDFKKAWATACRKAGVAGRLRHDFRRTAVRNLVNAGVPERVAMRVTGHKTRSVFDRYHIVSPADLQEATRKLEAARSSVTVKPTVIPLDSARRVAR